MLTLKKQLEFLRQEDYLDIYVVPPGIGDGIMATTVAANYHKKFGKKMLLGHNCPELFEYNPDIICLPEFAYYQITAAKIAFATDNGFSLKSLHYCRFQEIMPGICRYNYPEMNLSALLCAKAGISGEIVILPRLFLTDQEKSYGDFYGERQISIISTGRDEYKSYPFAYLEELIKLFPEYHFVQLGAPSDPPLAGAMHLQGKLTLRQVAAVLHNSRLFVGMVGALMHIARAVDCPSVILCPSVEPGNIFYYPEFANLGSTPRCTRCRDNFTTPVACWEPEKCTGSIPLTEIEETIRTTMQKTKKILSHQTLQIQAEPVTGLEDMRQRESFVMGPIRVYSGRNSQQYLSGNVQQRWIQMDHLKYQLKFTLKDKNKQNHFTCIEFGKKKSFSFYLQKIAILDPAGKYIFRAENKEVFSFCKIKNTHFLPMNDGRMALHPSNFSDGLQIFLPEFNDISDTLFLSFEVLIAPEVEKKLSKKDFSIYQRLKNNSMQDWSAKLGLSIKKLRYRNNPFVCL